MSLFPNQPEDQNCLPMEVSEDEYEIISSEEVDRVLDGLDQLINSVDSENIRAALEEAADQIYSLVYSDDAAEGEVHDEAA